MTPLGNRILFKPIVAPKASGNILLPEGVALTKETRAIVLAIGAKVTTVKVGDTVLIDAYSREANIIDFEHNGEDHHIISENFVIGIIPQSTSFVRTEASL